MKNIDDPEKMEKCYAISIFATFLPLNQELSVPFIDQIFKEFHEPLKKYSEIVS
jgi:hypothetical protein